MKNVIVFILCCVCMNFLYGCTNIDTNQVSEDGFNNSDEGDFLGIISDMDLALYVEDNNSKKLVIDDKLALEIGNSVIKSVYGKDVLNKTEFLVYELKGEGVFIVSRIIKGGQTLGGDYNVAIRKETGSIIKIWTGE